MGLKNNKNLLKDVNCGECGKLVYRLRIRKRVVCDSCKRNDFNDKRKSKRDTKRRLWTQRKSILASKSTDKIVEWDFIPGKRGDEADDWGGEFIGTVSDGDLAVVSSNGSHRIRGALKLQKEIEEIKGGRIRRTVF